MAQRGHKGMLSLRMHFRPRSEIEPGELDGTIGDPEQN